MGGLRRLHTCISECVVNPERDIIHVLSRRRLLEERSREEVDVACEYGDVPRCVPGEGDRGRAANERILAQLPGPDRWTDERPVDSVIHALSPDERPVGQKRHLVAEPDIGGRMHLNEVRRTDRVGPVGNMGSKV